MALQSKRDSGRNPLGKRFGNGAGRLGKSLIDATDNVARSSENLGALAAEVRRTREAIADRGRHPSPIEVVLRALTARR
jgi:hypothetical protein